MTTEEIHQKIQELMCNTSIPFTWQAPPILEQMNMKIAELEKRLETVEGSARHANNIASCLANGIMPD